MDKISARYCAACNCEINKYEFPTRGNICFSCEVEYAPTLTKKGLLLKKNKKDKYRAAKGSGYFPLSFNFVKLQDGKHIQCAYCGKFIHYRKITRDHVYPKSKGGSLKAPACMPCNEAKEDTLPIQWAIYAAKKQIDIATIPIGAEFLFCEEDREQAILDILNLVINLIDQKSAAVV